MSSGLLLAIVGGLLALALVLVLLVLVGLVALYWLSAGADDAPPPRPRATKARSGDKGRSGRPARPNAGPPPRAPRSVPTLERSPPPASFPPPRAAGGEPNATPMIGFFDDETSTGAALQQTRKSSLSAAFLSIPPFPHTARPHQQTLEDDNSGDGEATEIFSANTVSAELAALLEEPEEAATPSPSPKRG